MELSSVNLWNRLHARGLGILKWGSGWVAKRRPNCVPQLLEGSSLKLLKGKAVH